MGLESLFRRARWRHAGVEKKKQHTIYQMVEM
jgi:hypothetical protein